MERGRGRPKGDNRRTIEIQLRAIVRDAREQRWTREQWKAALEAHRARWLRPSSIGRTAVARATYYAALRAIIGPVRGAKVGAIRAGTAVQVGLFS